MQIAYTPPMLPDHISKFSKYSLTALAYFSFEASEQLSPPSFQLPKPFSKPSDKITVQFFSGSVLFSACVGITKNTHNIDYRVIIPRFFRFILFSNLQIISFVDIVKQCFSLVALNKVVINDISEDIGYLRISYGFTVHGALYSRGRQRRPEKTDVL